MKTTRFSKLFVAVQAAFAVIAYGGVGTWGVQTNLPQWNKTLSVVQTRQSCVETEAPDQCLKFVGSVATANRVKVFLAIALDTSTSVDYASTYSQLSLTAPFLVEIGIDDFVDQYKALFSSTNQPSGLLSTVIANVKSANPNLKFGATIYEDQLGNAYLQDAKLPASLRSQFDYIHLFIHYREDGPNFESYVQQAEQMFPNAKIIAGSYAYDRRTFLPCHPSGSNCTSQQEVDLFKQSIVIQAQLMRAGAVDSIEFFPGYFGHEDQIPGLNPRNCAPGDTATCIANTKAMREAAVAALGGTSHRPRWGRLSQGGIPARYGHSAVMDSANNRMIVFGGSGNADMNDTWILANANGQGGSPSWIPLSTQNAPPPGANYSAGMYDAGSNRMIVYGGSSGTDVWVLSNANGLGGSSTWTQLSTEGCPPNPFSDWQKEVYDSAANMLIAYDSSNNVMALSNANGLGGSPVWTQLNVANDGPPLRAGFTAVYNPDSGRMIVFGGSDGTTDFNDVWVLSNANGAGGTPTWTNVVPQGAAGSPAGRSGHLAVYDSARDVMTVFGGIGQPSDTWTLANASAAAGTPAWTNVDPGGSGAPDPRTDATAVLDTSSSAMIVFGGYNTDYLNDVWVLSGTPWTWWPDPATHRGVAAWISYSADYPTLWSNRALADQEIASLAQQGIEVAFLFIHSSGNHLHLQTLSSRSDSFTQDVQYALNGLAARNIRACAAILSDNFTGSSGQMQNFALVDHLIDFNTSRDAGDAGFTCVSTDLEMTAGYRSTAVYDLWKQFHSNMRDRIASHGSDLKLLAWIQGPDFLMTHMDSPDDRGQLMQRESISQDSTDPTLFNGALKYLVTQNGKAILDGVIPMWYFKSLAPFVRFVDHNARELQTLGVPDVYLVPGMMARHPSQGLCCPDCVSGSDDYESRVEHNDTLRLQYPNVIGTGVFVWPVPAAWNCQ